MDGSSQQGLQAGVRARQEASARKRLDDSVASVGERSRVSHVPHFRRLTSRYAEGDTRGRR